MSQIGLLSNGSNRSGSMNAPDGARRPENITSMLQSQNTGKQQHTEYNISLQASKLFFLSVSDSENGQPEATINRQGPGDGSG